VLATYFFAFQIYCDFSGYSDIAIGAARVLGYRLMTNFDRPYAAGSVAEFWRRWHVSLSTWFRDYLYVPLGGSRVPVPRWCFNVLVVFLVSGLWHGASWTFVAWGALHGACLIGSRLTAPTRSRLTDRLKLAHLPRVLHAWRVLVTFHLVALGWVLFRAATLADAGWVIGHLFSRPAWARPAEPMTQTNLSPFKDSNMKTAIVLIAFLLAAEWAMARGRERFARSPPPRWAAWPTYYALVLAVLWLGVMGSRRFIYFQF
jgi:D-alanyl-lipoteichoic acid acyltransferase DltB (MBOAT superfamily)